MSQWESLSLLLLTVLVLSLTAVTSLVLTIFALKKHRRLKVRATVLVLSAALLGFVLLHYNSHPTYYKYNDSWVLRHNIFDIEERYGPFDRGTVIEGERGQVGYYIYTDNGPIMPNHAKYYYCIDYDEAGMAYDVSECTHDF